MAIQLVAASSNWLTHASRLGLAFPASFAAWVKPTGTSIGAVWCVDNSTTLGNYFLSYLDTGGVVTADSDQANAGGRKVSGGLIIAGIWNHVAFVYTSATSSTVWVNGVATTSTITSSSPAGLNRTSIGAIKNQNNVTSGFFDGGFAYPAEWSAYALTAGDVATLRSGADPSSIQNAKLVSFSEFSSVTNFLDRITTTTWTVVGTTPIIIADPFSLSVNAPTVTVQAATLVTDSSATLNGNITNENGGGNSTIEGFNWGLTSSYGNTISNSGSFTTGAFTCSLTGLAGGLVYHCQAFSTNPASTSWSDDLTFTTFSQTKTGSGEVLYNPPLFISSGSTVTGGVANMFDGNNATTWTTSTHGAWAGINCGNTVTLTRLRYTAQPASEDLVIGATLNATVSDSAFTSPVVLYTAPNARPRTGTLKNEVLVSLGTAAYQYYNVKTTSSLIWGFADLDFIGGWAPGIYSRPVSPVVTPSGGSFDLATVVRMSSITTSASIYYTTDGTTPTSASTLYSGPITLSSSTKLQSIAFDQGLSTPASRVTTVYFIIPSALYAHQPLYDTSGYKMVAFEGPVYQDPASGWWYHMGGNTDISGASAVLGINVYKSADLRNWIYVSNICGPAAGTQIAYTGKYITRGFVYYNVPTKKYVRWFSEDNTLSKGMEVWTSSNIESGWALAATYTASNLPGDGFSWGGGSNFSGDVGGFVDPVSGNAYLIYNYASNSRTAFSLLDPTTYTNTLASGSANYASTREGHAMFYHGGTYFWVNSGELSKTNTENDYYTSSTPIGPWTGPANPFVNVGGAPSNTTGYNGQTTQIFSIPGRNALIWFGEDGSVTGTDQYAPTVLLLPISTPTSTTMRITWQNASTWFGGAQDSLWSLDTVFPTINGAPAAAVLSIISPTIATWENIETSPVNIYLDSADDAGFTTNVVSEVVGINRTSFTIELPGNFYRVRTVNANGSAVSDPVAALARGAHRTVYPPSYIYNAVKQARAHDPSPLASDEISVQVTPEISVGMTQMIGVNPITLLSVVTYNVLVNDVIASSWSTYADASTALQAAYQAEKDKRSWLS